MMIKFCTFFLPAAKRNIKKSGLDKNDGSGPVLKHLNIISVYHNVDMRMGNMVMSKHNMQVAFSPPSSAREGQFE